MKTYEKYLKNSDGNSNTIIVDETKKSNFVAKLIGLGVLMKDKSGKLKAGKNKMSKEQAVKKLKRKNWKKSDVEKIAKTALNKG